MSVDGCYFGKAALPPHQALIASPYPLTHPKLLDVGTCLYNGAGQVAARHEGIRKRSVIGSVANIRINGIHGYRGDLNFALVWTANRVGQIAVLDNVRRSCGSKESSFH